MTIGRMHGVGAIGAKTPVSADPHGVAAGIEVLGDFEGDRWSVLPGIYAPLSETVLLKTGIEFGREDAVDAGPAVVPRCRA